MPRIFIPSTHAPVCFLMKCIVLLLLIFCASLHGNYSQEQPWGRDAELAYPCKKNACSSAPFPGECAPSPLAKIGAILIRFHQYVISPIDGPRSHYRPSSSQYTLDAMRRYGFFTGVAMGCDRLLRENSEKWVYPTIEVEGKAMKWDPIDGCPPPCS